MMSSAAALDTPAFVPAIRTASKPVLKPVPKAAELNDEALFARASGGDRDALGALIERYEDFLYGLLVRLCNGDVHRAEDFFQDTFLNAMRAAATFDRKKSFKPWITAIAVNLLRDDSRRRKVRAEVALDPHKPDAEHDRIDPTALVEDPGDRAERHDEEEKVRQALERLTDLEREVVLLHFYNDMTLQETADALASPLGTIKSRLHAALTRLSGMLGKRS
ncbi:MAG TPA: RNA polymerase sigma factor [Planctomycetota bacterium]|nr:RNA polymerase sigma factor [Planctomycetota bacterium]